MTGLVVWLFCKILLTSQYGYGGGLFASLLRFGVYGGVFLCLFSELFVRSVNRNSLALIAVLAAFAVILLRVDGNDIISLLIIAFSSRRYQFRDILKIAMMVTLVSVLVVVGSFTVGVIGQALNDRRMIGSLGFGWTTFLSHYYLALVTGYSVLRGNRIKIFEIIIMILLDLSIWRFTGARNSAVLVLVFVAGVLAVKAGWIRKKGKSQAVLAAISFPICALLAGFLFIVIDPYTNFGVALDTLFTGRLALTHRAVDLYGIAPFGNVVTWVTNSSIVSGAYESSQYLYVDSSYINILINYGWVFSLAVLASLSVVAYKATTYGGNLVGIALIIFAIHGIVDPQLLDLHYCVFLLLLGNLFDSSKEWTMRMEGFAATEIEAHRTQS